MKATRRNWWILAGTVTIAFLILGFFGNEVYRKAPPIPERVAVSDGTLVFTKDDILTGQQVWQSTGGQQLGTIWGHGAYQAPDWSADWLHRESVALLNLWAKREGYGSFESMPAEGRAALQERLRQELRTNTYDRQTETVTISRSSGGDPADRKALRGSVRRRPSPSRVERGVCNAGSDHP